MADVIDDIRFVQKEKDVRGNNYTVWVLEIHRVSLSVAGPDSTSIIKTSIGWEEVATI